MLQDLGKSEVVFLDERAYDRRHSLKMLATVRGPVKHFFFLEFTCVIRTLEKISIEI